MSILRRGIAKGVAQVSKENLKRRLRPGERLIESGVFIAGLLSTVILLGIIAILLKDGLPAFADTSPWEFLFGTKWYPVSDPPTFGILPFFVSTLMITLIATLISVPIGIACAAYLSEIASRRINDIVKPIIEIMAGIPSVMIGFIGLALLSPFVQSLFNLNTGLCGLTASIMLSLMSLPIIVSVSEDALHAVPKEFKEASYALGATKWETILHVCIPSALSGIAAAIMLGIGRAIGETMTVLMVAGGALAVPVSPTDPMTTMTSAIASGIGNAVRGGPQYHALFAIGLILFILTLTVNLIAEKVLEQQKKKFAR